MCVCLYPINFQAVPGQAFWSAALQRLLHSPWRPVRSARSRTSDDGCGAEHPLVAQGSALHSPLATRPGRSWNGDGAIWRGEVMVGKR